ncbi:hypothetical protein DFAR_2910006 [Desulfarculales bacterium]
METIRQSLSNKLVRGKWNSGLPRSRQRHWLKGLLRQVSLYLGSSSCRATCLRSSIGSVAGAWPRPAGRRKARSPLLP